MKRFKLSIKRSAKWIHLPKLTLVLAILMALDLSMAPNVDAQRRGGPGRSRMSRSIGSHISSGYSRVNGSYGHFGRRGFTGRGFYLYRGVPYWRYSYMPFWGDYYWGIPPYALRFYLNGYNYYDCDGIYYKYDKDKYQVVAAPLGYRTKVLPKGCFQFTMDGVPYYYYFGTYYTQIKGQYEVVLPPIGAEVDSLPDGYDKVMIDGQTYYTLNGVQYKAVIWNNEIWYRVIKNGENNPAPSTPSSDEKTMPDNDTGHK
ncbi:MAG: DUF6515 family protein [Bacteroidota bacterium]|nr:DUF6515 family protein [Bacteroidota bacterium]